MDIKDINLKTTQTTEAPKELYSVPEDSSCIADINNVCSQINTFISKSLEELSSKETEEDKSKVISTCVEAARFMDAYRNIRLNVELSSKIKFNIAPVRNKE